jgi:hypothetical protein
MKHSGALLSAVLLIFAFSISGFSQAVGSPAGTPSSDTKEFTDEAEVTSNFDKSKNETTLGFKMMGIANTQPQRILLSASTSFAGEKLKNQPEDIIFILSIASPGSYKYPDIMKLKIKADGKDLPEVLILNLDKRKLGETEFLETIGTRMKYDVFKKISQAKTVEMQLENTKFQLTAGNIKRFADLVRLSQVN